MVDARNKERSEIKKDINVMKQFVTTIIKEEKYIEVENKLKEIEMDIKKNKK